MHYLSPEDGGIYLALRAAGRQWELPSSTDWGLRTGRASRRCSRRTPGRPPDPAGVGRGRVEAPRPPAPGARLRRGSGTLIKPLTWQGDIGFAPSRDGQRTFQRLEDNPRWNGIPHLEDAGRRAITAYLRTYGPATSAHIHHWLGAGLSAGRRRLDRWLFELAEELVAVDVEGIVAHVVAEDADSLLSARPSNSVCFLPGHDQWVMGPGTQDSHVTPPAHREAVTRKANPVIVGGVVRGTWAVSKD